MSLYLNCCVSSLIAHELVVNKFFCLGLACLLNEPKTKTQAWLIYKTNKHKQAFYRAESELLMIGLVHLQP